MSPDIEIEIGRRLRQLRQARGHSASIADKIRAIYQVKLDRSHLSRMERGKAAIPLRTLFALLDFYQASPQDILPDPGPGGARPVDPLLEHIRNAPGLGDRLTQLFVKLGPDKLEEVLFSITDALLICLPREPSRRRLQLASVDSPQKPAQKRRQTTPEPGQDRPEPKKK